MYLQKLYSIWLTEAGAEVVLVTNGEAAVNEALDAHRICRAFDIVLMDMKMPILDGYSATEMLREWNYPGLIIAVTA